MTVNYCPKCNHFAHDETGCPAYLETGAGGFVECGCTFDSSESYQQLHIRCNYHWRTFEGSWDLTAAELEDLSMDPDLAEPVFHYRGSVYSLQDFMRVPEGMFPGHWDGYLSDTFFSGVLIQLNDENPDEYRVATFYS